MVRRSGWWKKPLLSVAAVTIVLAALEAGLRVAGFRQPPRIRSLNTPAVAGFEGTMQFLLRTQLDPPGYIWRSETNTTFTDRYGFRKPELPIRKEPDKIRVAFLGGSTTQGGCRPYPERAIRLLNSALGTNRYEALNVACSSYSTHQSLIALQRWVLPRKPDIVVIYHGWNDCHVACDGFADAEKDFAANHPLLRNPCVLRLMTASRLFALLSRVAARFDATWPRPRVSPDEFRRNLEAMVDLCRKQNIRVIIIGKPISRTRPVPELGAPSFQAFRSMISATNSDALYEGLHRIYSTIQREVAVERNVMFCDAEKFLDDLQERQAKGDFGPDVRIFCGDACHLCEFAEEQLAFLVAIALSPENVNTITTYANGPVHQEFLAREFLKDTLPFEAYYHAQIALQQASADHKEALEQLAREAQQQFEFASLFRDGRWGGANEDFMVKLQKLIRCLILNPQDTGTRYQVASLCHYNGLDREAGLYAGLVPPPVEPRTMLNDGSVYSVSTSPDTLDDAAFAITHPTNIVALAMLVVIHAPDGCTSIRDVSVAATDDDLNNNPNWHMIRSRILPTTPGAAGPPFDAMITIPPSKDMDVITIQFDPTDKDMARPYKTWGLLCLSKSRGYQRNYCTNNVIAIRELFISSP
ncbi:MAG TPA: GDSL-type esterase/lipase family protein [Kiritimatiellia bacterium]|nr:GDSL-type esterase/lipase family protein [Kiritimatiellia bacterium]